MTQYINEIRPMVEEFHSNDEIIRRFELHLQNLKNEAIRCDDALKIYLSWQNGIAPELNRTYSESEFLELHNLSSGRVELHGSRYTLIDSRGEMIRFHYCHHLIYTPIRSEFTTHQCLRC